MRIPFALIAAALVLIVPATGAQAAQEDDAWRDEGRQLTFDLLTGGFDLRSVRDSAIGKDTVTAHFDHATATLQYQFTSIEPDNRSLIDVRVSVLSVVEYRDLNADGRLGLDDQVVQRVPLATMERRPMQAAPVPGGGHVATASYAWPVRDDNDSLPIGGQPPLVEDGVELKFRVTPIEQNVQGVLVAPTEVKFDIEITGFPYERPDSVLAVQTRLATANDDVRPAMDERRVYIPDGYFRAYYEWYPSARVDGVIAPVQSSLLAAEGGVHTVALSYGRGDAILHDPTVGVVRMQGDIGEAIQRLVQGNLVLYAAGGLVTAVAVAIPSVRRLKQG